MSNSAKNNTDVCATCAAVHPKCLAHKKRKNSGGEWRPCGAEPMENGCCSMHGGKSLRGVESPTFKHGRKSRYRLASANLMEMYESAREDASRLDMSDEVDLLTARIQELTEAQLAGNGEYWEQIVAASERVFKAVRENDTADYPRAVAEVRRVADEARKMEARWDTVDSLIEKKRRLQQAELKRKVVEHQMVPADKVILAFQEIAGLAQKLIADRETLVKFYSGVRTISGLDSLGDGARTEDGRGAA